jgi:hypothetical protein
MAYVEEQRVLKRAKRRMWKDTRRNGYSSASWRGNWSDILPLLPVRRGFTVTHYLRDSPRWLKSRLPKLARRSQLASEVSVSTRNRMGLGRSG